MLHENKEVEKETRELNLRADTFNKQTKLSQVLSAWKSRAVTKADLRVKSRVLREQTILRHLP